MPELLRIHTELSVAFLLADGQNYFQFHSIVRRMFYCEHTLENKHQSPHNWTRRIVFSASGGGPGCGNTREKQDTTIQCVVLSSVLTELRRALLTVIDSRGRQWLSRASFLPTFTRPVLVSKVVWVGLS